MSSLVNSNSLGLSLLLCLVLECDAFAQGSFKAERSTMKPRATSIQRAKMRAVKKAPFPTRQGQGRVSEARHEVIVRWKSLRTGFGSEAERAQVDRWVRSYTRKSSDPARAMILKNYLSFLEAAQAQNPKIKLLEIREGSHSLFSLVGDGLERWNGVSTQYRLASVLSKATELVRTDRLAPESALIKVKKEKGIVTRKEDKKC